MGLSGLCAHSKISFPTVLSILPGRHLHQDSAQVHLLKPFLSSGESDCILPVPMCSVNGHLGELLEHTVAIGDTAVISYYIMNYFNTGIIFIFELSASRTVSGTWNVLRKCWLVEKAPVFPEKYGWSCGYRGLTVLHYFI